MKNIKELGQVELENWLAERGESCYRAGSSVAGFTKRAWEEKGTF